MPKAIFAGKTGDEAGNAKKCIDRQKPVKLPKISAAYFLMAKNRKHNKNDRNLRERK